MAKPFPPEKPKGYEIEAPLISLNGDKPEVLTEQYEAIARECRRLLTVMAENAPHGRNFQGQGQAAFSQVQDLFRADVTAIARIENKYMALAEYTAAFIK